MNTLSKLSFLAMALTLASCNEKVSPQLQGANATSTTTGTGPTVVPNEYYFRIANNTDSMLNFKLHKTGAGNADKSCEVKNTLKLSSDLFRANPEAYDISCYFEAEELSLYYNGLDFGIEASPNTCEYIGYAPFSYFTQIPGDSSGAYTQTTCSPGLTTAFLNAQGVTGVSCNTYQADATSLPFAVATGKENETLCRFNGTKELPKCDIGIINITETRYSREPGADGLPNTPDDIVLIEPPVTREVDCAGKIYNCIEGAITFESLLAKQTSGMVITKSTIDTAVELNKTLSPLIGSYRSNRRYVNFRRDLASLEIEYGNSGKPLTNAYMSSFGDPQNAKSFHPELLLNYAYNKRMDGSDLVITSGPLSILPSKDPTNRFWYRPHAADPFLGLFGARTNPYYTAYCLDNAFEVKARIKMMVRDWDRVLPASPTNTYFERISDVDLLPPIARQDVPYTLEVTGDSDSWNEFNDIHDWDDLIAMERDDQNTTYDPSITIWRPLPTATYLNGFFNPAHFPYDKYRD